AFTEVSDCIHACVDAQLILGRTTWPTPRPLTVRMGINVGEAEPREGDYYGPAVNRAARIMAAGHGGQILMSEVAARLASIGLIPGIELVDLGPHRLKDLREPENLFQLVHPELPSVFPPLSTLESRPNNLPVQISEFLGRETELAQVCSMLGAPDVRLITLAGPGGTGKTRLALQAAAEMADTYEDGVFFVDLSAERDPDAAFEAILRDLGLTGAREGSPLQVLKNKLRDRHLLLLLDNLEQVTDAGVGIADLLRNCPQLVVMVTSREVLQVRGEHIYLVPTLGLPDPLDSPHSIAASEAVRLFVERAQEASSGFTLSAENAGAVAEITVRLDGLPLAIELAAARLGVFAPSELRDRLRSRLDVLGKGARDLPDRQRTLHSTIEWSYELLDQDECRVFELLSVFTHARLPDVEGTATAVHGDLDVVESLASLVSKSLVRPVESEDGRRFTMLQTIRDFAAGRLAETPETEDAVRLAHASWYTNLAKDLRPALDGPGRDAALGRFLAEIGNLRTAWSYWVRSDDLGQLYVLLDGLWALHESRGWYHAAVGMTTDLLEVLAESEPSPERDHEEMVLRISLARALMAVGGFRPEVEQEFQRALELAPLVEAQATVFPVLRSLATYYMNVGSLEKSAEMGERLLELGRDEGDVAITIEGHVVAGATSPYLGDLEGGLRHLDRAIALFDPALRSVRFRLGSNPGVVARIASAIFLRWGGWPDQSAARAEDALALARQLDQPFTLAYALWHVGFLALNRERWADAIPVAEELEGISTTNDYPVWRALASVLHGVADCGLGDADKGLTLSEAGHALYKGLATPPVFWPLLLGLRAAAFSMSGQHEEALRLIDEAIAVAGSEESAYPHFRVLRADIINRLPNPDVEEALESLRAAIRGSRAASLRLVELNACVHLVRVLEAQGRLAGEERDLERLYGTFTEGFAEPELVAAQEVLGVERPHPPRDQH
ncbi:MAG: NB-ARC domain-containing protein, partial [Acidimicrobiia bacterium]